MLKRFVSIFAVALLALVVLAACGDDDEPEDVAREEVAGAPDFPIDDSHPPSGEGTPSGGGQETATPPDVAVETAPTVTAEGIKWDTTELAIPAGTDVPFTLVNNDSIAHDFSVEGQGIKIEMPGSQTVNGTVNLPAGTYTFFCSVPGHEALMRGTLTVVEGGAAPGGGAAAGAGGGTPPSGGGEAAGAAAGGGAAQAVTVTAQGIQWDTTELTIPAGTDVPLTLVNNDTIGHDFSVEGQDIKFDMPPSQTVNATLNLPAGTYTYFCSVPGHEALMRGTLTVQ